MSLNSPFLRYFSYFYGNLGVQLLPFDTALGRFNFVQNLAINILVRYVVFASGVFNSATYLLHLKAIKPVFGIFFGILSTIYPITTCFIFIYYLFYGRKIIFLLDSPCLRQLYIEKHAKQFFALLIIANTVVFSTSNWRKMVILLQNEMQLTPFQLLIHFLSNYIMVMTSFVHMFLLHYLAYSTFNNLTQISVQLSAKPPLSKSSENALVSQFIQIASVNRRFSVLLSFPLMINYYLSVVYTISLIYFVFFLSPMTFVLIFPLLNAFYYFYLVHLNQKIMRLAQNVIQNLKSAEFKCLRQASFGQANNCLICRNELDIYLDYFPLSIFSLAKIDKAFLLGTSLLAINYIVFISQT